MKDDAIEIEMLFLALADKTRLRILNLMRNGEVSVNLFTTVLNVSQPKVSRHLAYLRNAGLAEPRRDGKWIYYGIKMPADPNDRTVLGHILEWLGSQPQMAAENGRLWGVGSTSQHGRGQEQDENDNISVRTNMKETRDELEIYLL